MQTPPPPLNIATIFMKDAHIAESNEKSAIKQKIWLLGIQFLSEGPEGAEGSDFVQIGGLKPHRKLQHSNSIRKCSKIGRTEPTFG